VLGDGTFEINGATSLYCDNEVEGMANYLQNYIPIKKRGESAKNYLRLIIKKELGEDSYKLRISAEGITIEGGDYGGVFNGVQSLLQMMPASYLQKVRLPLSVGCVEIMDKPRFSYRGMHLDVARTFVPAERVKRFIDLMAYHKLNKFHFHLTDDEGWRIEIKSHPEFAKRAGFRGGDAEVWPRYSKFDEAWGGYYTQEELRDIVAYAAVRNIEVIPEIDMPGHSRALAQIYPDILCNYTPDKEKWGGRDLRNAWCVAKESNYRIIEDVIREVADIFPSPYIHIGGDEVALALGYHIWSQCPDCCAIMEKNNFTSYMQLQDVFTARVADILKQYGKKPAVWNEAIEGGKLDRNTRVHCWSSVKPCKESAAKGFPTIVMPGQFFYFDSRQSKYETGHKWAGHYDAKRVSTFDLDEIGITPDEMANVEGVSGAFWGEIYIDNEPEKNDYLDYMLFPRLCVLSDLAWMGKTRNWDDLHNVLRTAHYDRLSNLGVVYRLEDPIVKLENEKIAAYAEEGQTLFYTDKFTGKITRYTEPLDAALAAQISFHSEYRTGHSAEVALDDYYKTECPDMRVTTSMALSEKYTIADIEAYKSVTTSTTVEAGNWIEYRWVEPIEARRITFASGYPHLHRRILEFGYVEVSYDGVTFDKVADLECGAVAFAPKSKVHALRVVTSGKSDAEPKAMIQPLKIER
jgi:hexosaminidase